MSETTLTPSATHTDIKKALIYSRPMAESDRNFIFSSWLRSLYTGSSYYFRMNKDAFYAKYQIIVRNLISRPEVKISIACLREDPDVILAYVVTEGDCLHWVYTKQAWREMGLAKDLIPSGIKWFSHFTEPSINLKPAGWQFDPFLAL